MKTTFEKLTPKISQIRDYKSFVMINLGKSLQNLNTDCNGLQKFLPIYILTPDKLPRRKEKYTR